MSLLLAGLALVPGDLLRAAQVDGASAWRRQPSCRWSSRRRGCSASDPGRFWIFDNIYVLTGGSSSAYRISVDLELRQPVQGVQRGPWFGDQRADLWLHVAVVRSFSSSCSAPRHQVSLSGR